MSLRRRVALFLDPSLAKLETDAAFVIAAEQARQRLIGYDGERYLEHIAKSLEKIEQRTKPRSRGRNIWCEHPELHPEVELVS